MTAKQTSLRGAALSGMVWSVTERWGTRAVGLVTLVVLGRVLGPSDFGTVATASLFVDLVGIFVATGFSSYLVQRLDIDDTTTSTALWIGLVGGVVLGLALFLAAPLIAGGMGQPPLKDLIRVLSASLLFVGVASVPTALLQRELAFRALAARSIVANLASGAIAIALALGGAGAWAIVGQSVTFSVTRTVMVWLGARWTPRLLFSRRDAKDLSVFAGKLTATAFSQFSRTRGEDLLVVVMAGTGTLGVWVIARRMVDVVVDLFVGAVGAVTTPIFAKAKSDPARLVRGYLAAVCLSAAIMSPALCLMGAVSAEAVPALFGEKWVNAGPIAAFMAIGVVFTTASYLDRGLLVAINRSGMALIMVATAAASHLVVAAATLALGASPIQLAAALAVRNALFWPVWLGNVRRTARVPVGLVVAHLLRIWLAAGLAGGAAWGLVTLLAHRDVAALVSVPAAGLAGGVLFLGLLFATHREVFDELLDSIREIARRRARRVLDPRSEDNGQAVESSI